LRVVFDTNIFISAFVIPRGNAEKAYRHAIQGSFTLYTSFSILTELAQKLTEKFNWVDPKVVRLIKSIGDVAIVVKTEPWLHLVPDEPDNRIIECAIKTNAKFIVTGDKHLLQMGHYKGIQILKLARFLEIVESSQQNTF